MYGKVLFMGKKVCKQNPWKEVMGSK
jgi:hypothetical protein